MTHFKYAPIDKDVSIFASGDSLKEIPIEKLEQIKQKTFVISLNSVNGIVPHMRIWADDWWSDYFEKQPKESLYVTRPLAFKNTKEYDIEIDYWFDNRREGFKDGNWTIYWLLQLLRKHFPDKKVYIFGMDCKKGDDRSKRYKNGQLEEVRWSRQKNHLKELPWALERHNNDHPEFLKNVYNCNPQSEVKCIEFMDFHRIL